MRYFISQQELVAEKQFRLKESMKMMGLANWIHWLAWFLKNFIFLGISCILLTILLKVFANQMYISLTLRELRFSFGLAIILRASIGLRKFRSSIKMSLANCYT